MSQKTASLLRELSLLAPVIVISGRGLMDLKKKVGLRRSVLVGNHGLEISSVYEADYKASAPARSACRVWKKTLRARLKREPFFGKLLFEDKAYSLSIHFLERLAPEEASLLKEAYAALDPAPKRVSGKNVMNLILRESMDKGQALAFLMRKNGYRKAFFIGDDVTDEDVFKRKARGLFTVRVGFKKGSTARYFLKSQSEIDRLLKRAVDLASERKPI